MYHLFPILSLSAPLQYTHKHSGSFAQAQATYLNPDKVCRLSVFLSLPPSMPALLPFLPLLTKKTYILVHYSLYHRKKRVGHYMDLELQGTFLSALSNKK